MSIKRGFPLFRCYNNYCMKLPARDRHAHKNIVVYASEVIHVLLYMLTGIGTIGIGIGMYLAASNLVENARSNPQRLLEALIVDLITILAVLEVIRTILSYLSEGRVRVTLIIDTVLIIMLNEIISGWFEDAPHINALYLVGVTIALMIMRILAIRYGPSKEEQV